MARFRFKWTKQYWGTRKGLTWAMTTDKIAGPLEAMRDTFGESILQDVVVIVGLAPTPVKRGGERFSATYEIVDLGRNRKRAQLQLEQLKQEAKEETELNKLLERNVDEELRKFWQRCKDEAETTRKNFAERLAATTFERVLSNLDPSDLVGEELAAKYAKQVLDAVAIDEKAAETHEKHVETTHAEAEAGRSTLPVPIIEPTEPEVSPVLKHSRVVFEELEEKLFKKPDREYAYNEWVGLYNHVRVTRVATLYHDLLTHLKDYDRRDKAIIEMARRASLRRKPIDELLGLVPSPPNC